MRQHGTVRRYLQGPNENDVFGKGCREVLCRTAHTDYLRKWRATGTKLMPVPVLLRRRLEEMLTTTTYRDLAAEIGIHHQTIRGIVEGTTKRIRPATLEKLGVLPEMVE